MPFEITLTRKIRADKEFVFDWWTDLSSEDTSLVKPLKSRRVTSRTPQEILLHDEEEMYFKRMSFDVTVTLKRPDSWTADYEGTDARARSEYRLQEEADGRTTLLYHTRVEPLGLITSALSPLVKPFVKRVFGNEMNTFIRALEEEYSKLKTSPTWTEERQSNAGVAVSGAKSLLPLTQ